MQFVVDAQLPPALAARLISAGYQAKHVTRLGARGVTDEAIWAYAHRSGSVILSKDSDFRDRALGGSTGPAVVWIRFGNVTLERLWAALEPKLDAIVEAVASGERLIELR